MDDWSGVQATYDRIADHFASTREYGWPEVESFLETAPVGGFGLDLGCGNCRHAEPLAQRVDRTVGIDVSRGLLETARRRRVERGFDVDLVQGDAGSLPVSTGRIDLAVYVATIHHLPSETSRRASLDELARVLSADGRALVSTWSTAHDRFDRAESFDTTVEWTLPGGETVDRFYHIYSPAGFESALEASDLEILEFELSSGNCYVTVTAE